MIAIAAPIPADRASIAIGVLSAAAVGGGAIAGAGPAVQIGIAGAIFTLGTLIKAAFDRHTAAITTHADAVSQLAKAADAQTKALQSHRRELRRGRQATQRP